MHDRLLPPASRCLPTASYREIRESPFLFPICVLCSSIDVALGTLPRRRVSLLSALFIKPKSYYVNDQVL